MTRTCYVCGDKLPMHHHWCSEGGGQQRHDLRPVPRRLPGFGDDEHFAYNGRPKTVEGWGIVASAADPDEAEQIRAATLERVARRVRVDHIDAALEREARERAEDDLRSAKVKVWCLTFLTLVLLLTGLAAAFGVFSGRSWLLVTALRLVLDQIGAACW